MALLFALWLPAQGDEAAHLHRTFLVLRGDFLWDNSWFRGSYVLASYSLLYYWLAAAVGNTAVAIFATVASSLLFGALVSRMWNRSARWSTWIFALFSVQPLLRAEYPFAVGTAFLLASLLALQRRRIVVAGLAAALCLASSPLAFAFLCIAAAGLWLSAPRYTAAACKYATSLALLGLTFFVLSRRFGTPWSGYPFQLTTLLEIVAVGATGVTLCYLARGPRPLAGIYAAWGLASVIGYVVPTPIGLSFARPAFILVPLLLVPAGRLHAAAKRVAAAAILALMPIGALALISSVSFAFAPHLDQARLWRGAVGFLRARVSPDYRVEVVPTAAHWEAYFLPRAGISIARGWYRQLDLAENDIFYRHRNDLSAAAYRRWLNANSVEWVVLPRTSGLDAEAGAAEVNLFASGRSGLRLVRTTPRWRFYEVPHAEPLIRPRANGRVIALTPDRIAVRLRSPGVYRLNVAYMPYWATPDGVAVKPARDGTTALRVNRPGTFTLRASLERLFGG